MTVVIKVFTEYIIEILNYMPEFGFKSVPSLRHKYNKNIYFVNRKKETQLF
jgi:hypothetical protein